MRNAICVDEKIKGPNLSGSLNVPYTVVYEDIPQMLSDPTHITIKLIFSGINMFVLKAYLHPEQQLFTFWILSKTNGMYTILYFGLFFEAFSFATCLSCPKISKYFFLAYCNQPSNRLRQDARDVTTADRSTSPLAILSRLLWIWRRQYEIKTTRNSWSALKHRKWKAIFKFYPLSSH